jgi:hypothetical protein
VLVGPRRVPVQTRRDVELGKAEMPGGEEVRRVVSSD